MGSFLFLGVDMTAKILKLNSDYTPLEIIGITDAWSLLEDGDAEGVPGASTATVLRSAHKAHKVPSILVLKKYVYVPDKYKSKRWSKAGVLERDNWTCVYCGKVAVGRERNDMTVDHVHPRSKGGQDTWSNTACACLKCNQRKADRSVKEAGMRLLWEPKRPRTNYLIASGNIPEDWKLYLGGWTKYAPDIRTDVSENVQDAPKFDESD